MLDDPIECPECGPEHSYLHPVRIDVDRGGQQTTFTAKGVANEEVPVTARGVFIVVTMTSETCDHIVTLRLQFHKGSTFMARTARLAAGDERDLPTIWRD